MRSMIKSISGFKDILPKDVKKWQLIEDKARALLEDYGFSEVRIPIIEKTDLFSRSIGDSTDIVEKQMYTFLDRDGSSITLRPEGTASVVRAYIEHNLYAKEPIQKLYYIGPMFRHERPQKGRLRQFYQIGAEVFGIKSPSVDVEILGLLIRYFEELKIKGLSLQINSLGCLRCRPPYVEEVKKYLKGRYIELCEDCKRRWGRNPLRVLDCKKERCRDIASQAPIILDFLCPECHSHFEGVKEEAASLNIPFEVNPRIVRGLDYYTKTTFEIVSQGLGAQNAVVAGGRFDDLVKALGGPDTPAIGFALGVERVVELLTCDEGGVTVTPKPASAVAKTVDPVVIVGGPNLFIAPLGEKARRLAIRIMNTVRPLKIKTEMEYEDKSLKAQMRRAHKLGARYVLIIGDEELKEGKGIFRDMSRKAQEDVPLDPFDRLIEKLRERISISPR